MRPFQIVAGGGTLVLNDQPDIIIVDVPNLMTVEQKTAVGKAPTTPCTWGRCPNRFCHYNHRKGGMMRDRVGPQHEPFAVSRIWLYESIMRFEPLDPLRFPVK